MKEMSWSHHSGVSGILPTQIRKKVKTWCIKESGDTAIRQSEHKESLNLLKRSSILEKTNTCYQRQKTFLNIA